MRDEWTIENWYECLILNSIMQWHLKPLFEHLSNHPWTLSRDSMTDRVKEEESIATTDGPLRCTWVEKHVVKLICTLSNWFNGFLNSWDSGSSHLGMLQIDLMRASFVSTAALVREEVLLKYRKLRTKATDKLVWPYRDCDSFIY